MATIGQLDILLRTRGLSKVKRDLGSLERLTGRITRSIAAFGAVLVFRRLGQGLAEVVKSQLRISDAMAEIKRTTGLVDLEIDKLTDSMVGLSRTMAGNIDDFLALAQVAGRAGLRSRQEIEELAVVAAQFGKISKISFEQSAKSLIGLSRAFGASKISENVKEIATTIVLTAKEFATTEKQVVEGLQRFTASIGALNLGINQSVVLVTAVTEIIGRARKAGTELNSAFFKAGTNMQKFAKIMGVDVATATRMFNKDAGDAILQLFKMIAALPTATQRLNAFKDVLGLVGAKAGGPVAQNMEKVFRILEQNNKALETGTALLDDYEIRMSGAGEQAKLLESNMKALSKIFGDEFTPDIEESTQALIGLSQAMDDIAKVAGKAMGLVIKAMTLQFRLFTGTILSAQIAFLKLKQLAGFGGGGGTPPGGGPPGGGTPGLPGAPGAGGGGGSAELTTARILIEELLKAEQDKLNKMSAMRDGFRMAEFEAESASLQVRTDAFSFFIENQKKMVLSLAPLFQSVSKAFETSLGGVFKALVRGTLDLKQAFKNLGLSMIDIVIDFVAQLVIAHTIGRVLSAISLAFATAQAAALSAAWAPAAFLASVATLGGAVAVGGASLAAGLGAFVGAIGALAIGSAGAQGGAGTAIGTTAGPGVRGFAEGGVVSKPTVALIGEGGEREFVIPESKMGAMGSTVIIQSDVIFLEDDVAMDRFARALEPSIVRASNRSIGGQPIELSER